ncbi:MAG: TetR/AcrR family transcriptional regulator [Pseudomonadota bacterium]
MSQKGSDAAKRKRGRPRAAQTGGREDIKKAALEEFAKTGFKGTSIDQIAGAAGVAKPLIHYHFKSKATLWQEAVGEAFDELRSEAMAFGAQLSRDSHEDALNDFAAVMVKFNAEHRTLNQIALDEVRQGGARADWLRKTYLIPLNQLITFVISMLVPEDQDVKTTASHITPSLIGALQFPSMDADVIQDAYGVDVDSAAYMHEHSRFIALLFRACLDYAKSRAGEPCV